MNYHKLDESCVLSLPRKILSSDDRLKEISLQRALHLNYVSYYQLL